MMVNFYIAININAFASCATSGNCRFVFMKIIELLFLRLSNRLYSLLDKIDRETPAIDGSDAEALCWAPPISAIETTALLPVV